MPPQPASPQELDVVREHLRLAREALPRVPDDKRTALERAVARAEQAVERYATLATKGETGQQMKGAIVVAGGFVFGNNTTGVGVADDVLLPFLAVAFIAVHMVATAPSTSTDLNQAWNEMIDTMEDVGRTASVEMTLASMPIPPRDQCTAHYAMCLGTRLGYPSSGGLWGHSICRDCLAMCQGDWGQWPPATGDGKDCKWWNYTQGGAHGAE